jgi:hypothetical protein
MSFSKQYTTICPLEDIVLVAEEKMPYYIDVIIGPGAINENS